MQPSLKLHKVHSQNSQVNASKSKAEACTITSNCQIRSNPSFQTEINTKRTSIFKFPQKIHLPSPYPQAIPTATQLLFSSSSRCWSFASRASAVSASACARSWRLSARSAARSLARSAIASADISSAMGWVEKEKRDRFKNPMVYHKMF